jgi:hypothetical protein
MVPTGAVYTRRYHRMCLHLLANLTPRTVC